MNRKSRGVFSLLTLLMVSTYSAAEKPPYIGWAQEAHADYSYEMFLNQLKEQKKYGANLLWIGHNNPGYVDKQKVEPGLSYAVYEALQDEKSPHHADALEMVAAVKRLLDAGRKEDFKAVLAIGYQIQMGPEWNRHHPDALRQEHNGRIFSAGGPSASFLSPVYQQDIQAYYRWVDRTWVIPYRDVIFMLNLADEPHGGDYSVSAEAAFKAQSGLDWVTAAETEAGRVKKGRFQDLYIVDYARWSANVWRSIDPSIRVTMSFCGSHGRFTNFEPSIAAIFRDTPDNFDVTFDAFLIDNNPGDPIDGKNVSALAMFLRQVGDLSQKYHRRVWLWPEANNWILSQWNSVKGNISDALWGLALLRNMAPAAGIRLGGLAIWNLDVKEQGLFRDTHPLIYDPQRMFEKISADFRTEADPVQLRQNILVWIPVSEADYLIGWKSYDYADRVFLLTLYAPLLERGIIPQLSSDNEPPLGGVRTIFLLSRYAPHLLKDAYQTLDRFVDGGGVLICNYRVLKPAGPFERFYQGILFYGNAVLSSITGRPRALTLGWGRGKIILVFGEMNEQLRNIVRILPPEVIEEVAGPSDMPVDVGTAAGVLSFPQKKTWVFYNTNPLPVTAKFRKKSQATLVAPDGSLQPVRRDQTSILLPHGAWLKVAN